MLVMPHEAARASEGKGEALRVVRIMTPEQKAKALIDRLAAMPLPTEDLTSTWCPPDWEDIVEWWDQFVREARELSPNRYRDK